MKTEIRSQSFNPWKDLLDYQQSRPDMSGKVGATTVFIGTMRDTNEGDGVQSMVLEHYPGMTEKYLQAIGSQAMEQWDIEDLLIIHRSGEICPDEPIVLVAVWSQHRAAAYEANRFIMENLKSKAPFWKKETLSNGMSRWVERNTPG